MSLSQRAPPCGKFRDWYQVSIREGVAGTVAVLNVTTRGGIPWDFSPQHNDPEEPSLSPRVGALLRSCVYWAIALPHWTSVFP